MLQIDADPGPGAVASAHDIDQYIGRLEMCGGLRMARFPALQTRERDLLAPRASNLEQRQSPPGRLDARRLRSLSPVVRRPGRIAQAMALKELEQACERARDRKSVV